MEKNVKLLVMSGILILLLCHYAGAESWEQVVSNGFGDSANDYAWSIAEFKGKLYIGTLNFLKGAQIWCSSTGGPESWNRVYKSPSSLINIGVRNLYVDQNKAMYACTLSGSGAQILRTTDGRRWIPVKKLMPGGNAAFRCMVRFGEYLYAGAGSDRAELYRSKDGFNWRLVMARPSLSSTRVTDPDTGLKVNNNTMIGELAVFQGYLYAFTWTREVKYRELVEHMLGYETKLPGFFYHPSPGAFEVWRSKNGTNWEKVVGQDDAYGNGMGFCLRDPATGMENDVVTSTAVFNGQLYLGTLNDHADSAVWRTSDGTHWTKVLGFFDLGEQANYYVWRMIPFQGRLFIGTMNVGPVKNPGVTGAQIWVSDSGAKDSFYNLVHNGFDGETWSDGADIEIPKNIGIRTFGIFNDTLFAGTATIISTPIPKFYPGKGIVIAGSDIGCEVWKMIPENGPARKSPLFINNLLDDEKEQEGWLTQSGHWLKQDLWVKR